MHGSPPHNITSFVTATARHAISLSLHAMSLPKRRGWSRRSRSHHAACNAVVKRLHLPSSQRHLWSSQRAGIVRSCHRISPQSLQQLMPPPLFVSLVQIAPRHTHACDRRRGTRRHTPLRDHRETSAARTAARTATRTAARVVIVAKQPMRRRVHLRVDGVRSAPNPSPTSARPHGRTVIPVR